LSFPPFSGLYNLKSVIVTCNKMPKIIPIIAGNVDRDEFQKVFSKGKKWIFCFLDL
jgi:hypothetical protein